MSPIAILGAGSWGTALAILLARNGQHVRLWGRDDSIKDIQSSRINKRYLPNFVLDDSIEAFTDLEAATVGIQDFLIVVPSGAFRSVVSDLHQLRPTGIRLAWASKGLDSEKNQLLHQVAFDIYQDTLSIAVIAGPSFAKEVAAGLPTAITLTSNNDDFSRSLIQRLHGRHFRVYSQMDLIGVQVCGAVKNCLAVATGISDGLGYGANARSALITRGLIEMTRLGLAMGGQQSTFMGLAGVGDLVLTCTDDQSRNRRFGVAIGQGADIACAEKTIGQVVEGKLNAFKVLALAKEYNIEMPIIEQVCNVLKGEVTPFESVEKLFAREPKREGIQ
ncbi:MAG: NAD(P)-dependent glycerol-3-phosphate dehydrogenase [Gammaproteobacteria bacterium]|nr:NAD(P)-dependent glycerol-3-phosphate dehydrogenase [Gammaproteobacteria bacterium]